MNFLNGVSLPLGRRGSRFFGNRLLLVLLWAGLAAQAGSIRREVFFDIPGNSVAELTSSPSYPNSPGLVEDLTEFFEAPTDQFESYGQRVHGYIVPPVTGNYTFWISSDDNGELYLSTDENPANVRRIASVPEWTGPREWEKYAEQKSATISLQANKAYYISALMKEGGGGDNLAVRWLRPGGIDEGPIPATHLLPWGTAFTPPAITQQPTNSTVIEGQLATFVVKVSNIDPVAAQWRRNGLNLAGANALVLSYGPVTLDDQGASFGVVLTNRIGATNTTTGTLTVVPDTTAPVLLSGVNLGAGRIQLQFSEPMDPISAASVGNFTVNNGVTVSGASVGTDPRTILLTVSPLTFAQNYTVTVRGLRDRARTPNTVAAESSLSFLALEFVSQSIGAVNGSIIRLGDGAFQVTGGGRGSGRTSDEFQFAWEQRTVDFDLRVRVDSLQVTDPYVQAGLMARASLETNSAYAAVFTSSAQVGSYFESRSSAGANQVAAAPRGGFPFNGRITWLRLQRTGSTVSGFGSLDGRTWTLLGSVGINLGSPVYVGLAASSRETDSQTAARFYEYGTAASPVVGVVDTGREPLGPTTRKTGIVVSEIMYHPKPPPGVTNNLEFVELYNAGPVFEDLSGWRLGGAVEYTFPAGTKLEAGAFVLVAADPLGLQNTYQVPGGLGPFRGSLNNSGESIQVFDSFGALKLEFEYSPKAPWPVAADGGGVSLVLARPSYGSDDPRAWSASEVVGGSPGTYDAIQPSPLRDVVINEFLAHTDDPQKDYLELFNRGKAEVDLSGCILTDDPTTNRFRLPAGTRIAPRGYLVFDQDELGFRLSSGGEQVFLFSADGTRVLDAVEFGGQENGVSSGRSPDGGATIRRLVQPTPGAGNAAWRQEAIVINEIMYQPISGNDADEYLELHNRSTQPVNLSGWRLTEGVEFEFASGTTLPAGGFLAVAKDAARLRSNHPSLEASRVVGNYTGTLANRGERIALAMPDEVVAIDDLGNQVTNVIHIVVAEAFYREKDRWHQWADGGGSSLELTDPEADPLEPTNWADSDESAKAPWTTVSFTGTLDHGMDGRVPDRFQISLMGAGECLVDDVEFFKTGGANLIGNADFEGAAGWQFWGNHFRSRLQTGEAFAGNRCLRLVAEGDGDTGPNSVRADLATTPTASGQATLRAKVRWLRGWPEILLRTHGNWIEAYGRLTVPSNLGSPGQVNGRLLVNAGPVITEVQHRPLLPTGGQAVTVTARVADPDGLGSVVLRFRVDPSGTASPVVMRDDGAGVDVAAGDGIYSATLTGRSEGSLVAFRVEAADAASLPASRTFPPKFPESECLVRWGDPAPNGSFGHYHLWTTQATENARGSSYGLNNRYRDLTVIYGNTRAIYGAGFRDKGSPFHGGYGDFAVTVPGDDLLLGTEDRVLGLTGNGDTEETGMRTQVANWIASRMGIPHLHSHYIRLYRNGSQYSNVMEDLEQPNNDFAEGFFPAVDEGDLYKIAVWFEFNDDNQGFDARGATLERFNSPGLGLKPARYRWNWQTRGWLGSANNLTNIFNLVGAANTTADYANRMQAVADMEQWMRVFAFNRICGNWDSWTFSVGQNMYLYFQPGERAKLLPWDIDFVLGRGNGPQDPLGGGSLGGSNQDPVANAFYNEPAFRRALFRSYLDAANGPMLPAQYGPQLESRRAVLQNNGFTVGASGDLRDPKPIATYLDARRNYLLSQVNAANRSFAITTSGGGNFTATQPVTTLTGTAPFAVAQLEINGVVYPVRWTDVNTFSVAIPLSAGANALNFVGRDRNGNALPGATDSITVTYNGPVPQAADFLVINEIQYDSPLPGGSFIELYNRSVNVPFELSGLVFSGVGYTFPSNAVIAPNSYLVLAKDRTAFALAYGNTVPVFDVFPGALDNGGETLTLLEPGTTPGTEKVISSVRYDDDPPWPAAAAGLGSSLQLVDSNQSAWRVANWTATATNDVNRVTPGRANALRSSLAAFPTLWLNEVLPQNVDGPVDNHGEREPFIELYNSGTAPVEVAGLVLTDTYSDLARWSIPAGTPALAPGAFLVIWADGEPTESVAGSLHTNFRLNPTNGAVALVWSQGSPAQPGILDYVNYAQQPIGRSVGSYPDGEPRGRRTFFKVTPGAANDPAFPPVNVVINEFMASNTRTLTNLVNGKKDDWFELYNVGTTPVDLTGYFLSDSLTNRTQFQIPAGFVVPPGGFLLVWADEETKANTNGSPQLHTNFKLGAGGEDLALFGPDGALVDGFSFGAQQADVSQGRFPDGQPGALVDLEQPSPGEPNLLAGGNRPPVVTPIAELTQPEGTLVQFKVQATDEPGQTIRFSLGADAPPEALLNEVTGDFRWTPTEAQGPGVYSFAVRASDNGTPSRTGSTRVTVTVTEANQAPVWVELKNHTVDERSTLSFQLAATDADVPANNLTYEWVGEVPLGLSLDAATGLVTWTPTEAQGPGVYPLQVRVVDSATPSASTPGSFVITVNEVNNPPDLVDIQPQSAVEGQPFVLRVLAVDADNPPASLRYSLEGTVPAGLHLESSTGLISWTPTETQGPGNYVILLRVTENNAAGLSTARSFGLNVAEANQSPRLDPLPEPTAEAGTTVRFTATATDLDLPAQGLVFTLEGTPPPGASLDGNTGEFAWTIPADSPAANYEWTIRVSDGVEGSSASAPLRVQVIPRFNVVLSEIMYRPASAKGEYVELKNASAVTAWDLSGYRLIGETLSFTFPAGTTLAPGELLCVAQDAASFRTLYGTAPRLAGAWTGSLGLQDDYLRLSPPAPSPRILSPVRYSARAPWPTAANGSGASLQLIDDRQSPSRVANWSGAPAYNGPRQLVVLTNQWRYYQSGPLEASWKNQSFVDSAWPQGRGLLYREDAELPAPKNTLLNLGQSTYYFRTQFELPSVPAGVTLSLSTVIDDGAVFYLNGQEVHRQNIPADAVVDFNTPASPNVADATLVGPITLPAGALQVGVNVLAVEVHQSGLGSSDIVMGCRLDLEGGNLPGLTPGASNNVAAVRTAFPEIWLNEVVLNNTTGLADRFGEREPWVEIHNAGRIEIGLAGWALTDSLGTPGRWVIPAGTRIPAGGFVVVFLDDEVTETGAGELHASFRPAAGAGVLALSRPTPAGWELADYLEYPALAANEAWASLPDGQPFVRSRTSRPTPGAGNSPSIANQPPVLSALGAVSVDEGTLLQLTPNAMDSDAGQVLTYSWVGEVPASLTLNPATGAIRWTPDEAVGPAVVPVTLRVTDNGLPPLSDEETFAITVREVNRQPVVDAIATQSASVGELWVLAVSARDFDFPPQALSFSLEGAPAGMTVGASSGVISWTPSAAAVGTRQFQVRVTDAGNPILSAVTPVTVVVTGGSGSTFPVGAEFTNNTLKLTWASQSGVTYRVETVPALGQSWTLVESVVGTGQTMTYTVPLEQAPPRFFRVVAP